MLATIASMFGRQVIDRMFGSLTTLWGQYINKQITEAQLKEALLAAMVQAFKEIEISHADALTKMYASFMGAVTQSPLMMRTWAFVTISQALMLLWFEFGIPFVVAMGWIDRWPSAGSTADWAYALVGGCLGLGMTLGKSSGGIVGGLKSLVGK